jgi:molybdopterin-containing oxidoreductase family membrane subunit
MKKSGLEGPKMSSEDEVLQPITKTGAGFYVFVCALLVLTGWWVYSWYTQLTNGLVVTGLRAIYNSPNYMGTYISGGSPWGIYVTNFIFWIGISHAGIAISASVRLMNLTKYKVVARMAEVLTMVALPMAALSIVFDLGRPDRVFNLLEFGRFQAPLLWDLTAITTYFMATIVYLYLSLRGDIDELAHRIPKREWFYKRLAMNYEGTENEKQRHTQTLWWLALAIVPIMVTVHSVVSFVFGLLISRGGWYSSIFAIYFVVGAIVSGVAAVYSLAWIFRWLYKWQSLITDEVLRGISWALRNVLIIYIYLWIAEELTVRYMGTTADLRVSNYYWFGPLAPLFWTMAIVGIGLPALILLKPIFGKRTFSPLLAFVASVILNIALWVKRFTIVVPSLLNPPLYPTGVYIPTVTEVGIMLGTFWIATLLYVVFIKLFPIIDLDVVRG